MSSTVTSSARHIVAPAWLPLVAVAIVALALRQILMANADVSWGLTLADKWLDGGRLYVDVIEVNPPATVFLYVVPAAIARLLRIDAAVAVDGLVFLAIAVSLFLGGRVLWQAKLIDRAKAWPLLTIAVVALAILPAQSFGEREHIALIAFLPLLAVSWVRAAGKTPSWPMILMAGLGGGITAIIKPYFALAIFCSGAMAAWSARSWRVLFAPENIIAAAALALYAVFVWLFFPAFIDMLPMLSTVYLPVKLPLVLLVLDGGLVLLALLLHLLWRSAGHDILRTPTSLLLAAAAGFCMAYVVQRKGWPYHSYPMLTIVWFALGQVLLTPRPHARMRIAIMLVLTGVMFFWFNAGVNRSALAAAIRAVAPQAKVLALSDDLSVGHPATRQAGGVWVGRVPSLWISDNVANRLGHEKLDPVTVAALNAYAARDRAMLAEDIVYNRPDVILAQIGTAGMDWLAWARSDPVLAVAIGSYRPDRTVGDVLILRRDSSSHLAAP